MKLLLIGCGNIGNTLLHVWAKSGLFTRIIVVQPSMGAATHHITHKHIEFFRDISNIPKNYDADLTVLAIKPQSAHSILPALNKNTHKLVVSLLAGVSIIKLTEYLAQAPKIIRMMPNIALKLGESTNLAHGKGNLTVGDILLIEKIFSQTGEITWLPSERQLDLLTPICGSGPAYFLLMAELLTAEAIKMGITPKIAHKIVHKTFVGSALLSGDQQNYEDLISSVTSKKGVTDAAMQVLRPKLTDALEHAIKAALTRLEELANENRR